jgi:hypothetical protein
MTGVTAMGVQGGEIAMQHQGFLLQKAFPNRAGRRAVACSLRASHTTHPKFRFLVGRAAGGL